MASLVEMAGSSLYGGYTQGTNGLPASTVSNLVGYSNPGPDGENPIGSGMWGIGNENFAFGNVKNNSIHNRKSLHNAGAAGVSFYGPINSSPDIGTGNYMDPFASSGTSFAAILADQPYALSPQAPGSYEHGVQSPPF